MERQSISRYIRHFLFNNMSRQILIFLFFLILSGIFWLILTLNQSYEYEIKIPYSIKGIPKNVVLTSNEVDTLKVTVRDKGWIILRYLYHERRSVWFNYKNYDRGNGGGIVSSAEVTLYSGLPRCSCRYYSYGNELCSYTRFPLEKVTD